MVGLLAASRVFVTIPNAKMAIVLARAGMKSTEKAKFFSELFAVKVGIALAGVGSLTVL